MAKISVLLPVYNGEKYLADCLESLICQTLTDIEIVAIDNASEDGSAEILRAYTEKDPRLVVIRQDVNVGPGGARNIALNHATGDYIAFCDCDDLVPKNAYTMLYEKALETDADVVVADYMESIDGRNVYHRICGPRKTAFVICEMGALWNKLYRREFFENNYLRFQEVMFDEDMLFLGMSLQYNPRYALMAKPVYVYRRFKDNTASQTRQMTLSTIKESIAARTQYNKIVSSLGYQSADELSFYSTRFIFCKWCGVDDEAERRKALQLIQNFVEQQCSWKETGERFKKLFGMRPDEFSGATYEEFITRYLGHSFQIMTDTDQKTSKSFVVGRVETLFKEGKLGLRCIWRYFRNWAWYKMNRRKARKK